MVQPNIGWEWAKRELFIIVRLDDRCASLMFFIVVYTCCKFIWHGLYMLSPSLHINMFCFCQSERKLLRFKLNLKFFSLNEFFVDSDILHTCNSAFSRN